MHGGLIAERMNGPWLTRLSRLTQPLKGSTGCSICGPPCGSEGEIDTAIAVDVHGLEADVVFLCAVANDVRAFPGRVFVPDDGIFGHGDQVGFAIGIDVGHGQCVTDLTDMRVDLLSLKRNCGRQIRSIRRGDHGHDRNKWNDPAQFLSHGRGVLLRIRGEGFQEQFGRRFDENENGDCCDACSYPHC